MKPWQFAFAALALLVVAGCRSNPSPVPLLERELRLKEDEIYRLRATIEDLEDAARAHARRSASAAREESDREMPARGRSSDSDVRDAAPSSSFAAPKVDLPSSSSGQVPNTLKLDGNTAPLAVPDVPAELQGPSAPDAKPSDAPPASPGDANGSSDASSLDGPALGGFVGNTSVAQTAMQTPASRVSPASPRTAAGSPKGNSRRVASIVVDPTLTGGISDGNGSADKGVLVVIEPRDAKGRLVDAPADVSIVIVDPEIQGNAARVARWDFTAAQTAAMFRRTGAGPAIYVEGAWSEGRPKHDKLHVFVRYTTADGRKLEVDQPIEIALADDKAPRRLPQRDLKTTQPDRPIGEAASTARRPVWSPERQ